MSSCISASGTVNQRLFGARGLSMRGETLREHARDGRPGTRPRHSTGPPPETSAHATPCRKTPYARCKTRTPRPCGRGAHSESFGAPVSRAPLEVVRCRPNSERREVLTRDPSAAAQGHNPACARNALLRMDLGVLSPVAAAVTEPTVVSALLPRLLHPDDPTKKRRFIECANGAESVALFDHLDKRIADRLTRVLVSRDEHL